jgi:hypothetical protein
MDDIEVGQIRETTSQFAMGMLHFKTGDTFIVRAVGRVVSRTGDVDNTLIGCELEEFNPNRHSLPCFHNGVRIHLCAHGHGWWVRRIYVRDNTKPLGNNVVWEV